MKIIIVKYINIVLIFFYYISFIISKSKKNYFILKFEYECKYDEDEVSFAYCVPYNYSKLIKFLKEKFDEQIISKNKYFE